MMMNKTIIRSVLGASALLTALGSLCFAAEATKPASVPAAVVTGPKLMPFDPATYKGETGKIVLAYEGQGYLTLSTVASGEPECYLMPVYKDGAFIAPVGIYHVIGCGITKTGKNGVTWRISLSYSGDLVVKAGSTTRIGAGSLLASFKSGKTGTLVLPSVYNDGNVSLCAMENGKPGDKLTVYGMGKPLVVPCGTYTLTGCFAGRTDKAGTRWMVNVTGASGKAAKTVSVKSDAETKIEINDSLVASVDVNQSGENVTMRLKLVNASGEVCTVRPLDPKADPPGFEVLDDSGKLLMSGKFAYG